MTEGKDYRTGNIHNMPYWTFPLNKLIFAEGRPANEIRPSIEHLLAWCTNYNVLACNTSLNGGHL